MYSYPVTPFHICDVFLKMKRREEERKRKEIDTFIHTYLEHPKCDFLHMRNGGKKIAKNQNKDIERKKQNQYIHRI